MSKNLIIVAISVLITISSCIIYSQEPFNIRVVSSSYLNNDSKYSINNIFDSDIQTCWVEGVSGDGSGPMVQKIWPHCDVWSVIPSIKGAEQFICMMPYELNAIKITKIRIYNGYGKSDVLWKANNRVKKLGMSIGGYKDKISFDDTNHCDIKVDLQDKGWNDIILSDYLKGNKRINYISSITFYILETYKSSKYNDTCISEIEFYDQNQKYNIDKVTEIIPHYGVPKDDEGD